MIAFSSCATWSQMNSNYSHDDIYNGSRNQNSHPNRHLQLDTTAYRYNSSYVEPKYQPQPMSREEYINMYKQKSVNDSIVDNRNFDSIQNYYASAKRYDDSIAFYESGEYARRLNDTYTCDVYDNNDYSDYSECTNYSTNRNNYYYVGVNTPYWSVGYGNTYYYPRSYWSWEIDAYPFYWSYYHRPYHRTYSYSRPHHYAEYHHAPAPHHVAPHRPAPAPHHGSYSHYAPKHSAHPNHGPAPRSSASHNNHTKSYNQPASRPHSTSNGHSQPPRSSARPSSTPSTKSYGGSAPRSSSPSHSAPRGSGASHSTPRSSAPSHFNPHR